MDKDELSLLSKDTQHQIWRDAARGIEYIHSMDIIHRDIKPQNILLGEGDRGAVICDFGIAAKIYNENPALFSGGTPCYIPPEQLDNYPRGKEADIWAFGVTMLFVFRCIKLPRGSWLIAAVQKNRTAIQRMRHWLQHILRASETLPKALALVRGMLTEKPADRTIAAALVKNLHLQPQQVRLLPA